MLDSDTGRARYAAMADLAAGNFSQPPVPDYARPDETALMRNRILSAAAHLFTTRGFHGTTTRAISEIVGILSGSLFHHFKSKRQMLFEVMHQAAQSLCVRAEAVVTAAPDTRARLRAMIRLQLDCLLNEQTKDFYAVLLFEWREMGAAEKAPLTALRKRYFDVWHSVLQECDGQGLLRAEAKATQFILHGAINWATTWYKPQGRLSLDDYALLLEEIVLAARSNTASGKNKSAVLGPGGSRS